MRAKGAIEPEGGERRGPGGAKDGGDRLTGSRDAVIGGAIACSERQITRMTDPEDGESTEANLELSKVVSSVYGRFHTSPKSPSHQPEAQAGRQADTGATGREINPLWASAPSALERSSSHRPAQPASHACPQAIGALPPSQPSPAYAPMQPVQPMQAKRTTAKTQRNMTGYSPALRTTTASILPPTPPTAAAHTHTARSTELIVISLHSLFVSPPSPTVTSRPHLLLSASSQSTPARPSPRSLPKTPGLYISSCTLLRS